MQAQAGDRIVVESSAVDRPRRIGEVLDVLGEGSAPPYRVRWSDGVVSIVYPGPDAQVKTSKASFS